MTKREIIRAWKDPAFRSTLDPKSQKALPANPAGLIEVTDADLVNVNGGKSTVGYPTFINCTSIIIWVLTKTRYCQ